MNKKLYRAWFFTNERLNKFLIGLKDLQIKKIFAIGGSGDFAFNLLSLLNIKKIDLCDIRPTANLTINFKKYLFRKNSLKKALGILTDLNCLKKTGLWYKYSFKQIKYKKDYLLYLTSEKKYQLLQKQLKKINIFCGDFIEILNLSKNNYYDLIYLSNILDSKEYNQDNHLCLEIIRSKLKSNGFLIAVTQNNDKKTIKLIKNFGFQIIHQETHQPDIFSSFLDHYAFSFLLFKKEIPDKNF